MQSGSWCIILVLFISVFVCSGCVTDKNTTKVPVSVTPPSPTPTSYVIVETETPSPTTVPAHPEVTTPAVTTIPPTPSVAALETGEKKQIYPYTIRGMAQTLYFDTYDGVDTYLQNQYPDRPSDFYNVSTLEAYYQDYVSDPVQKKYLDDIIDNIHDRSYLPQERARIAISLIQHIPYKVTSRTYYPYEVLSYNSGKCEEKSILAAYVLTQQGYGTALLLYYPEHHMALGLKCPRKYSVDNSGYCFVETTTPTIMTFSNGSYSGVGKLTSHPEVIRISEGDTFEQIDEEYTDARQLDTVLNSAIGNSTGFYLDSVNYNEFSYLNKKYGLIGTFSGS